MIIIREIDDETIKEIKIKLTVKELQQAYYEQEALFIQKECEECIYEMYGDKIESGAIPFDELLKEAVIRYKHYKEVTENTASDISSAVMDAYRETENRLEAQKAKSLPVQKAFVVFGRENFPGKDIYYVQIENSDFLEPIEENIDSRSKAMFIAAQKAVELGLEIKEA